MDRQHTLVIHLLRTWGPFPQVLEPKWMAECLLDNCIEKGLVQLSVCTCMLKGVHTLLFCACFSLCFSLSLFCARFGLDKV